MFVSLFQLLIQIKPRANMVYTVTLLNNFLLVYILKLILIPLAWIFRGSYNSGQILQEWKLAKVVPIFKKDKKSE